MNFPKEDRSGKISTKMIISGWYNNMWFLFSSSLLSKNNVIAKLVLKIEKNQNWMLCYIYHMVYSHLKIIHREEIWGTKAGW